MISVNKSNFPPQFYFSKNKNNVLKSVYKNNPLIKKETRIQNISDSFRPNGAFYISNIKKLLKNKNFFKGKILGLEMPAKRSIDIDTIEDLKLARYFFEKKYNFMKKNCYIIAEIGVNHNNKISLAKKLISSAKKCGADAVKFQTFNAERLANINTPKAKYQKRSGPKKETHFEMLKKLELSEKNHFKLKQYCNRIKIDFISTPYDLQSLKFLIKLGLKVIKTSSADLIDHQMHNYLAKNKIKVIISTGMSKISEIDETIKIYRKYKSNKFSLLHCVSNYPCSDLSLNLKNIITLRKRYNCEVGFSDHSLGEIASIISIGYGAKIIEKHFTLNKNMYVQIILPQAHQKNFLI